MTLLRTRTIRNVCIFGYYVCKETGDIAMAALRCPWKQAGMAILMVGVIGFVIAQTTVGEETEISSRPYKIPDNEIPNDIPHSDISAGRNHGHHQQTTKETSNPSQFTTQSVAMTTSHNDDVTTHPSTFTETNERDSSKATTISSPPNTTSSKSDPLMILMITHYRGGSSFLGDLFGQHPEAFYWFEPLEPVVRACEDELRRQGLHSSLEIGKGRAFRKERNACEKEMIDIISRTLACDVDRLDPRVLQGELMMKGTHMPKTEYYYRCMKGRDGMVAKRWQQCRPHLTEACRKASIYAVKSIRFPMYLVADLLKKMPNLKVISYIRDPRAMAVSRQDVDDLDDEGMLREADEACLEIMENHEVFESLKPRFSDNLLELRYEDLALKPYEVTEEVYTFVDRSVPREVKKWLKLITQSTRERDQTAYSTIRNSTEAAIQWREEIDSDMLKEINKLCRKTILTMGYSL